MRGRSKKLLRVPTFGSARLERSRAEGVGCEQALELPRIEKAIALDPALEAWIDGVEMEHWVTFVEQRVVTIGLAGYKGQADWTVEAEEWGN